MTRMEEALKYIHNINWNWMGALPGLDRTVELMNRIGNPQKKLRFVHIAGTNGKGSTAAMLASVLKEAGYRTGLYTSPYIIRFNERMQINNEQISDDEVCDILERIRPEADAMADHPTEFELVTAIGMEYFARHQCDIVVLEVGMGGEMDATNVIDAPEAAVMVNIGLDHTQFLGDTIEKIAATKSGIIKPGCDCVVYNQEKSVEEVIAAVCAERGVKLHLADYASITPLSASLEGQRFDWRALKNLSLPLLGEHQLHNAATVLTTLKALSDRGWNIPEAAIRAGLAKVTWPGRFEILRREPMFLVDGGHNPQCLEALENALRAYLPDRKIVFLNGCMADKDFGDMFNHLLPFAQEFVTVKPDNPRALSAENLSAYIETHLRAKATPCATVRDGVLTAIERAGKNGVVCACGSLYMIGDIVAALDTL